MSPFSKAPKKPKTFTNLDGKNLKDLDFKDIKFLSRFVTERGKILPRKITGLNSRQQSKVAKAIKRARQSALLPFLNCGDR